jgi:hypothetical protein
MDTVEGSALLRYQQLKAALDRCLFAEAMELDCRLSELERRDGIETEYSLSLTDHAANLRLIEERIEQLESKLLPQAKPN